MDPDLPEVRVAALLVIRRDGDLHHERPNIAVMQITEVDRLPAGRLIQLFNFYLLPEKMHTRSHPLLTHTHTNTTYG